MAEYVTLPNVRKLFVPDPGYDIFDADLKGADAQVVAWEAGDEDLKAAFRAGLDVHNKNAEDMWGSAYTQLPGTIESGPKYKKRKQCKQAVHATNYGGSPTALSRHPGIGWTVHESEQFQRRWFSIHPQIKKRIERIQHDLDTTRTVTNGFGYRRVFFDRPDACLPEALAWTPQSTVALVSFRGAIQLEKMVPQVEMLLQVHDSVVFQVPRAHSSRYQDLRAGLSITIPYDDPLTIQWGLAKSSVSWGDCTAVKEAA